MLDAQQIEPGSLIALPETFSTGYSMQVDEIQEDTTRVTTEFLSDLAKRYASHVVGGLVRTAPSGKGFNTAVVFDAEGNEVTAYHKMHVMEIYGEDKKYERGSRVVTFEWAGMKVAPVVCYDLRFPEVFRKLVRQGVQMFVVIANWPTARATHWGALLKARAIENLAYVVGVNRTGEDPNLKFGGKSVIFEPFGEVMVEAGDRPEVISTEVELEHVLKVREDFPVLEDIRDDLMG